MRTVLLILALAAPLLALTEEEVTWAHACIDRLGSANERVRKSAGRALAALGVEVVPLVVARADKIESESAWAVLRNSFREMGAKRAATALESESPRWPKTAKLRLAKLVLALQPASLSIDPEVDRKVRALLKKFEDVNTYSSGDPNVRKIIKMGRPAAPSLIAFIKEQQDGFGMEMTAATDALAPLVLEEDRALLGELLLSGKTDVAKCLAKIPGEQTLDLLLEAVRDGQVDHDLVEALRGYAESKRMRKALIAWLDEFGREADWTVGAVAQFLGEIRAYEALPVAEKLIGLPGQDGFASGLGEGLVLLGSIKGVPLLIRVVEDRSVDAWARHAAAQALNKVTRRNTYTGTGMLLARGSTINLDRAGPRFRKFYEAKKDKLYFDREAGVWKEKE